MNWQQEIEAAEARIRPYVRMTPVERSPWLEAQGAEVFLKLEGQQVTSSFKARGAMNKLLSLSDEQRARGVIAASSGNHGAAVAYGAQKLGCSAMICVPNYAAETKVDAIRSYGAEVHFHGDDCLDTEKFARALALEQGRSYCAPYNDTVVVHGQGTLGVELARQIPELDAVLIAVGGGGLIGGVGRYLKSLRPELEVIACSPERSPAIHECLKAGRVIDVVCDETLSDATAGGVEENSVTLPLCQQVIDRSLLVTEEAIADGMRLLIARHHILVEGAAAVVVAGWRQIESEYAGKRVALVICGANITLSKLKGILP